MRIRFISFVVASFFIGASAFAQRPSYQEFSEGASGWVDKKPIASRKFMVAAAHPLAVEAGYEVLKRGGNAIDASVAVQLVLNLVEPQSSGIGGGAFMLYHDAKHRKLVAYDGRETAPTAAKPDRFLDPSGKPMGFRDAVIGGRSVGVPGTLALLAEAHRRHGSLAWATLFEPAIAIAERGFAVSPRLNTLLADEARFMEKRASDYFYDDQGRPRQVDEVLRNPAFAATLRKLAAGGARAFYTGDIARDIVATANSSRFNPGDLTPADLAAYRVVVREPICGEYRIYRVCGMPLPSSGGLTLLQILEMLEPYDLRAMGPASLWSVHFISEAGRLAYADRGVYMADPAFYRAPSGLLDPRYLAQRSQLIHATASMGEAKPGTPPGLATTRDVAYGRSESPEFASTSHISIVDRYGNAVAMSTTIEHTFGSRLMTESGFLLNNELTDFSFAPVVDGKPVANRIEPGKRPRSSMAPTIVYDKRGRIFMIVGSPGSSAIINYVAKTLIAVIDWNMDPQAAIDLPNFGSRNGPTELELDTRVAALAPKLEALGHKIRISAQPSGIHAIARTPTGWIGGADPRREGIVRGD